MFMKSIYEGSNLSVGASCILITRFSRKYKLPCKAQNDLLTLLKLHCPEGVEIALPQTYKELLKKTTSQHCESMGLFDLHEKNRRRCHGV